jgi:hypothetical protein
VGIEYPWIKKCPVKIYLKGREIYDLYMDYGDKSFITLFVLQKR